MNANCEPPKMGTMPTRDSHKTIRSKIQESASQKKTRQWLCFGLVPEMKTTATASTTKLDGKNWEEECVRECVCCVAPAVFSSDGRMKMAPMNSRGNAHSALVYLIKRQIISIPCDSFFRRLTVFVSFLFFHCRCLCYVIIIWFRSLANERQICEWRMAKRKQSNPNTY